MKKNILILVTESESANGICAKAVMSEMVKQGHNVYCITNKEYNGEKIYTLNGVKYYTVRARYVVQLQSYLSHNRNINSIEKKVLHVIFYLMNKIKLAMMVFCWPLISPLYSLRIYSKLRMICKENRIDILIPVYSQIDPLIAANMYKKSHPKIKYIPYFLDSLSGGYGPKIFSKAYMIKRGQKWERRLLKNADKIIVMESSRKHHQKHSINEPFYKKIRYYDLPLIVNRDCDIKDNRIPFMKSENTNIVYVGSLPSGIRNPEYFLRMFSSIKNDKLQLYFIGDDQCSILSYYASKDRRIHIIGKCDHSTALCYEKEATILLNFGNSNPSMTPSKIFEYMSWCKPIITTYYIDHEPSLTYLSKYPITLKIDEREGISENVIKLRGFIKSLDFSVGISFEELNEVFAMNSPKTVVTEILNE